MPETEVVELRWVLGIIRRRLWLIVVCALLGALAAFAAIGFMPPTYSASVTFLVQPGTGSGMSDYQIALAALERAMGVIWKPVDKEQ